MTENRNDVDRSYALSAKFIYELNQKTAFINNTQLPDLPEEISEEATSVLNTNYL